MGMLNYQLQSVIGQRSTVNENMRGNNIFNNILSFFLTKIIIGIAAIAGAVILIESALRPLLEKIKLSEELINGIVDSANIDLCFDSLS